MTDAPGDRKGSVASHSTGQAQRNRQAGGWSLRGPSPRLFMHAEGLFDAACGCEALSYQPSAAKRVRPAAGLRSPTSFELVPWLLTVQVPHAIVLASMGFARPKHVGAQLRLLRCEYSVLALH